LTLSQRLRAHGGSSDDTRHIATLLEGRCRSRLAIAALRQKDFGEAARLLSFDGERLSISPLLAIVQAVVDRVANKPAQHPI